MGAHNHPTTEPDNASMSSRRERLRVDLNDCDGVTHSEQSGQAQNAVLFHSEGSMPGDITSEMLGVLAEHDAFLPGDQPGGRYAHLACIHMD